MRLRKIVGSLASVALLSLFPVRWLLREIGIKAVLDSIFDVAFAQISDLTGWSQARISNITDEYIAPVLVSAVVVWIIWHIFRWINKSPQDIEPRAATFETISKSLSPDWSLRDLFIHVDQDVLLEEKTLRDAVGREISDKCSSNHLQAWGKLIRNGKRNSLAPIPREHWENVEYTFWFLKEDDGQSLEMRSASSQRGGAFREYAGILVNRAQALTIWTTPNPVPLHEAARLMYEALRGLTIAHIAEREGKTPEGILKYFGNNLLHGHPIRAQRPPSTKYIEIPSAERHTLRVFDGATRIGGLVGYHTVYGSPYIKRQELDKAITETKRLHEMII